MPDDKKETYKIDDAACSPEFSSEGCKLPQEETAEENKPE